MRGLATTGSFGQESILDLVILFGSCSLRNNCVIQRSDSGSILPHSLVKTCCYSIYLYINTIVWLSLRLYYNKSIMTILQACWCKKMNRHRQNGSSFVIKKILTSVPREIRRGLKATADKRVTTLPSLYPHSF